MLDLEEKELQVGAIYHMLGSGSKVVISKFSHETEHSFVFKPIKKYVPQKQGDPLIYTWKRVISRLWSHGVLNTSIPVIRVSQGLIDKYQIS